MVKVSDHVHLLLTMLTMLPSDDDCDKPTVTIVKASVTAKQQNVETKKCDFKSHTQACAHYYSAIHNGGKNRFTCEDSNERVDGPATRHWKEQHNDGKGWGDYVDDTYTFKASTGDSEDGKDTRCEAVSVQHPRC